MAGSRHCFDFISTLVATEIVPECSLISHSVVALPNVHRRATVKRIVRGNTYEYVESESGTLVAREKRISVV